MNSDWEELRRIHHYLQQVAPEVASWVIDSMLELQNSITHIQDRVDIEQINFDEVTEDWFTIYIQNGFFPCMCGNDVKFPHIINQHDQLFIIVWPKKDDPSILKLASELQKNDFNPKIIEYESGFGSPISWYRRGS